MQVFTQSGPEQTPRVMDIVVQAVRERPISQITVASNTGATAISLLDALDQASVGNIQVIVVTHVQGFVKPGENEMSDETRRLLQNRGCVVVTAAHALSGGERAFSGRFKGVNPLEIVAHTLRLLSQGVKVALEITMMAMDAGALTHGNHVLAIGGSGRGADTAVLLTPATSAHLMDSRIHEILCKPA